MSLGAAEAFFVDLAPVANTTLENDGQAGWCNEGVNDMFLFPPLPSGEVTRNGYRFSLLDPDREGRKTVLMLRGQRLTDKPREATVAVPRRKGRFAYFLQHSVARVNGQPANYRVAVYTVRYTDGSQAEIPVHDGVEIHHWWTAEWYENSGAKSWPIFMGRNSVCMKWNRLIGVWAMQWSNPAPEKEIVSISFRSEGLAAPAIFAVTITDDDYPASPHARDDYRRPEDVPVDYFARKLVGEQKRLYAEMQRQGMVRGLRSVELLRPDLVAVTLDAVVAEGAGMAAAKASALQRADAFSVTSDNDPAYQAGRALLKVGRRSYEDWNGDVGPFPQNVFYGHTYYLLLPKPLSSGQAYRIEVRGVEFTNQLELAYDERNTVTPALKVNQVAYSSVAERRYAYLGWWAGDAGKVDYAGFRKFQVVTEPDRRVVLEGETSLRKGDDVLSGEDVWQLDLSPLKPGRYHVQVPGLGRSDSFSVGGEPIRELYYHANRAFFHQRCGCELRLPFSDFSKPLCHTEVYANGHLVGAAGAAADFAEPKRSFRGGYHDAADFDVFTYHLRATAQVLAAYEFAPGRFRDGDLNLPESGNGIPDVLDEADWALLGYRETQQADGGVPLGRGNDQDALRDWEREHQGQRPPYGLFPPTSTSCTEYAAVAAQFARFLRRFDAPKADRYVESARRALTWAEAHPGSATVENGRDLFLAWAAAELYATTGEQGFDDTFKRLYRAGAMAKVHWKLAATAPICEWAYLACQQPGRDLAIQQELKTLALQRAEAIVKDTEAPAYRVGRGAANRGNGWGNLNGGGRWADPCLRAYFLTRDRRYLDAASLNADFQLGANPLSKTFLTGLGARFPEHPEISEFLYTGPHRTGATVKGITVYGLTSDEPPWYPATPPWRRWRDLGNGGAEISSEFTITETIGASAMLYSVLYALEPERP
jgi:endoglucanase